jgi:hypothetical protein
MGWIRAVGVGVLVGYATLACDQGKRDAKGVAPAAPTATAIDDAQRQPQRDAGAFSDDLEAICVTAKQLVERVKRCAPRSSSQVLDDTRRSLEYGEPADSPRSARETWASICAGIAKGLDDRLAGSDPACRLTADERGRNDDFLASYDGRRTTPRPSGDANVDRNLHELAAARDALCACTDEDCERAAEKTVTTAVRPVPPGMTAALEDAVAISDEVSRCRDRITREAARSRM